MLISELKLQRKFLVWNLTPVTNMHKRFKKRFKKIAENVCPRDSLSKVIQIQFYNIKFYQTGLSSRFSATSFLIHLLTKKINQCSLPKSLPSPRKRKLWQISIYLSIVLLQYGDFLVYTILLWTSNILEC